MGITCTKASVYHISSYVHIYIHTIDRLSGHSFLEKKYKIVFSWHLIHYLTDCVIIYSVSYKLSAYKQFLQIIACVYHQLSH